MHHYYLPIDCNSSFVRHEISHIIFVARRLVGMQKWEREGGLENERESEKN